jgi:glycosyltransferase involved in cell wall biosynthesis
MRSAVISMSLSDQPPWWWDHIKRDRQLCEVDHLRVNFRGKRGKQITTLELPFFLFKVLARMFSWRKYDYVYTVECDLVGLGLAFWQSLLFVRKPRHVILQFIMRERTDRRLSRLKYALLAFVFRSVHRVICSSRTEADYYRSAFSWEPAKACFVPILTDPSYLADPVPASRGDYLLAAGRVFRDYATAIEAVKGTPFKLVIVGAAGVSREVVRDEQIEVMEEIPQDRFNELMQGCAAVVIPLMDRKISVGQTVLLQAMAMGKMVIATRTAGTLDYVEHGVNGLLVAPGDVGDLRSAMCAAGDAALREALAQRARETVVKRHLPHHYTAAIRRAVVQ